MVTRASIPSSFVLLVVLGASGCSGALELSEQEGDGAGVEPSGESATGPDGGTATGPSLVLLSPTPGDTVDNPVRFEVAAEGVDQVEILADQTYSLGRFDPAAADGLLYRFAGTGAARELTAVGLRDGVEVVRTDFTLTVSPDSCEERFFVTQFDQRNADPTGRLDLVEIREAALAAVEGEVAALHACGADVTLGGMMSLLLYEGGLRAAAYNTRCSENSYNKTERDCDADPEAMYSYQFGLGAIHASNFHPCRGGAYTQGMRSALLEAMAAAGYPTDAGLVTASQAARFRQVCPASTPNAVDHYLLGAHDVYDVPRNGAGNALGSFGRFPLFSPEVSIAMTFGELEDQCASMTGDRAAIAVFGGADTRYRDPAKQDVILSYYRDYAATSCP